MSDEEKKLAARARLGRILPLIASATKESLAASPPGARQILGVGYQAADGSGRLVARLDAEEFFADLALALGVDCSETAEVRADMVLTRLG